MKQTRHILYLLPVAMLLAACTQDELTDNGQGMPLPEPVPLQLTAAIGDAVATPAGTRGTIDDDWSGAKTVAVRVNNIVKEYTVESFNGNRALLVPAEDLEWNDADMPFWWTSSADRKTVDSWYPYNNGVLPSEWTVSLTQTAETMVAEDLMYAYKRDMQVSDQSMTFEHQLSKVVINLKKSDYLEKAKNIVVSLSEQYREGLLRVSGGDFILMGRNKMTIYPYRLETPDADYFATYQAFVIPLDIAGGTNSCLCITVDGITYKYKLSTGLSSSIFISGNQYTYNVTVKAEGLSVTTEQSIGWNTGSTGSGSVTVE